MFSQTHQMPVHASNESQVVPVLLPLDLLRHVAGGLPYNGYSVPDQGQSSSSEVPATELPYNGY